MNTHNFIIAGMDTDSIAFCKQDGSSFSLEQKKELLKDLNNNFPNGIVWDDDGIYPCVVVLKAKNYILLDEKGKIKKKGSGLKSSKIEKGLLDFMNQIIDCLLFDKQDQLIDIYNTFIKEVNNLTDITRWTSKHTVTHSVLNPTRTNEQKQLDAINGKNLSMGDKFFTYFTISDTLKVQEKWTNDHNVEKLMERIYKTLCIFENVINMQQFPKYHLKRSKKILKELIIK